MFVTQSVAVASSLSNQGTSYISLDEVTGGRREERERRPSGASVEGAERADGVDGGSSNSSDGGSGGSRRGGRCSREGEGEET